MRFLILALLIGIPSVASAGPVQSEVSSLCELDCEYSVEGECPVEDGASCPETYSQCHARCMRSDGSLPAGISALGEGALACRIEAVWTEYSGGWLTDLYAREVRLVRCGAWYYIGPQNWYRSTGQIASK